MTTQAQTDHLAAARAAKAAKAASDAVAPNLLTRMLDADYIRDSAVPVIPPEMDFPIYGEESAAEIAAAVVAEGGVKIVDSSTVDALQAQLDAANAQIAALAAKAAVAPHGRKVQVMPEPADPYATDEDMTINELNLLNGADVVGRARAEGRLKSGLSKVLHSNSLSQYDAQLEARTFWMYAKDGTARQIMRQSVESAKHSGLFTACPLCDGWHKGSESDPNACPMKPRHKFTICQTCVSNGFERYIFDTPQSAPLDRFGNPVELHMKTDDPNYVNVAMPGMAKDRLQVLLEDHIRAFHTSTAASMHLAPLERVQAGQGSV